MRFKPIFCILFLYIAISLNAWSIVQFAQLSDPHIFEDNKRASEAKVSTHDFEKSIEKMNEISKGLKSPLNFVLLSGDIGIGKLLTTEPITNNVIKATQKWSEAIQTIANMLIKSNVKKWFFVPGNNDLYEERAETVSFFSQFLKELQNRPEIRKAGLQLIDFRLDSAQKAQPESAPGIYLFQNFLFVGWDNSFFKNNNSLKNYFGKDGKIIPLDKTIEYQSLEKLKNVLESSKATYAYIFYHIPDIDDPYLVLFDESKKDNIVSKRMKEALDISPTFAKDFYPYSAWTVPAGVRDLWEKIILRPTGKGPEIRGLFAGHFHDHKKETYLTTNWLKDKRYQAEILKKLFLAPPISVKNQTQYPLIDRATGLQIITINDNGSVIRKAYWFE
jgi:hypothetical protein